MAVTQDEVQFYKESLRKTDNYVMSHHETGKALKDVVGKGYELHRKSVWEYFGCDVSKEKYGALFDVDWSITHGGKLIAFEEDKGHYLDSCFMERALTGYCKTANAYIKRNEPVPLFIIHSFTKYKKFND